MFRKMIALLLIFAMLVPFSSAAAADEPSESRSMEEILDEYHRQAFESQAQGQTRAASPNTRSGGKTLEEETVDALTEAGYEAYNVTSGNYDTLEADLKTDFAAMGLDPAGSYIIVISGEDPTAPASGNSTRGLTPNPGEDQAPDDGGGATFFSHTYNGETYWMRYVTVTADINTALTQSTPVNLLDKYGWDDFWNDMNVPVALVSLLPHATVIGILYSLCTEAFPDIQHTAPTSLLFIGATNWTPTYIQVYDAEDAEWQWRAVYEYATAGYYINKTHYDAALNKNVNTTVDGTFTNIYSTNYDNTDLLLDYAAMYHNALGHYYDTVETVEYTFDGEVVITHTRWSENYSYEPA